jgi:hypothetical protein
MLGGMKMFGSVFVLGRVAAADVAARQTKPQVDPGITHLDALFATLGFRFRWMNVFDVRADVCHGSSEGC